MADVCIKFCLEALAFEKQSQTYSLNIVDNNNANANADAEERSIC